MTTPQRCPITERDESDYRSTTDVERQKIAAVVAASGDACRHIKAKLIQWNLNVTAQLKNYAEWLKFRTTAYKAMPGSPEVATRERGGTEKEIRDLIQKGDLRGLDVQFRKSSAYTTSRFSTIIGEIPQPSPANPKKNKEASAKLAAFHKAREALVTKEKEIEATIPARIQAKPCPTEKSYRKMTQTERDQLLLARGLECYSPNQSLLPGQPDWKAIAKKTWNPRIKSDLERYTKWLRTRNDVFSIMLQNTERVPVQTMRFKQALREANMQALYNLYKESTKSTNVVFFNWEKNRQEMIDSFPPKSDLRAALSQELERFRKQQAELRKIEAEIDRQMKDEWAEEEMGWILHPRYGYNLRSGISQDPKQYRGQVATETRSRGHPLVSKARPSRSPYNLRPRNEFGFVISFKQR